MSQTLRPDPKLWGERVAARQARRTKHPSVYNQDTDEWTTIMLAVSPIEANIIIRALATHSTLAAKELALDIRAQVQARTINTNNEL
jgi:hypothetical protein